ncbi:H-NS histone family protein [Pollutimonas thiosulfatoxidans]|uniref:DNA-binding protein n=1 Tax=Pollutimonas thiosulfatoxidans TaxID=2028345 RepID=A0A410GBQ4_9BURK|nr:H-NS histone family protein [Pollutimonas thiosulfatoxidans]QAA93709.1 DNA-binding protein [Pollutimonas thiosulfatoxidans]
MTRDSYTAQKQKIEKEIQKLQKQALALQTKRRGPVVTSILRSMREYDITPDDIASAYNRKTSHVAKKAAAAGAPKRTVPPKYRNPKTGDTWTGRGKAPRWITAAESEGQQRDSFLIKP